MLLYVVINFNFNGISGKYFFDCNEYMLELVVVSDMEFVIRYWKFSEEFIVFKFSG